MVLVQDFEQQIFDFLMESQFWSPDRIVAYQRQQLAQLLNFAHHKVAFYKERLAFLFDQNGAVQWQKWRDVPILTRRDLIDHRALMLAAHLPAGHGAIADHEGSGTTGSPVTTRHNTLVAQASQSALWRAYEAHGITYGKNFVQWMGNDEAVGAWPEGREAGPWGPGWHADTAAGKFFQINRATSEGNVAEFLQRRKAHYFSGRPRSVQAVALAAERIGVSVKLDALSTFSTAATEEERADCARVFGAPIINLYASKEVYNIAHQCPRGHHYHINSEIILVEVIDDQGAPCPPGVRGRIIVTPFFNTSQPLIRYELGDEVTLGPACSCGCKLPVLAKVDGRTTHLFRLPGGRKIAPSIPPHFRSLIAATSWQMAQTGPNMFEVRYLSDGSGKTRDFATFTHEVRKRIDPHAEVIYQHIETLPLTPSGKFIEYVCEWTPDD